MEQKALVIGLGVSGCAAAHLLADQGATVWGIEGNRDRIKNDQRIAALRDRGVVVWHQSELQSIEEFDLCVVSPGISPQHPCYRMAKEVGLNVIGEAELACRHIQAPMVAVTGTNGKTTVASLAAHIAVESGLRAHAVGNIGDPLSAYVKQDDANNIDLLVVELSSFQLETMYSPVFSAAVLLNITPDHLDRYDSFEEYAAAKCRLQRCLKKDAPFYVEEETAHRWGYLLDMTKIKTFGYHHHNVENIFPLSYRDKRNHDVSNGLAAYALCREVGITPEAFRKGFETFKKPPHRMEFVRNIDGVSYVNDSKGTNVEAVVAAVNAASTAPAPALGRVILIAGGVDKGSDFTSWTEAEAFQEKVAVVITIGQAADKIAKQLASSVEVWHCDHLEQAVRKASAYAENGDCVLLSPGCASFDHFRDYAHRGEEFKRIVHVLS